MAAATCLLPGKCSSLDRNLDMTSASMEAKEGSSNTYRNSSVSCVTGSGPEPKSPQQHRETVQMLTRHRRKQQEPVKQEDSMKVLNGAAFASNRASQNAGTAGANLHVLSSNGSDRSMNSKLLFMPSASCQPPAPTLPPLPDSPATGLACSSSAVSYSSSVIPPKAEPNTSAIGIPIPPPQPKSTPGSATTLPPLRSIPGGAQINKASSPQFRKVFVPSTVIHNGVAQQMLVPMLCMVAPMRHQNGSAQPATALWGANKAGCLPNFASKRKSENENESSTPSKGKCCNKSHTSPPSPLRLQSGGTQKAKPQALHQTRFSTRIANRGAVAKEEPKEEDQCSDTAALTLLADAALMDL